MMTFSEITNLLLPLLVGYVGYIHTKLHKIDVEVSNKIDDGDLREHINLHMRPIEVLVEELKYDITSMRDDIRETNQDIKKLLERK